MPANIINLTAIARQIERPFVVTPLAALGDLAVSLYICEGQLDWHRHLHEDELFLTHEGVLELETERGSLTLHAEELAVVPKGVAHRSSSVLRSTIVLIRPVLLADRKNGHRVQVLDSDPPLEKVRLAALGATLTRPYTLLPVARVEENEVALLTAHNVGPEETAPEAGILWLVLRGAVDLMVTGEPETHVEAGELTVVPAGKAYHLTAAVPARLLTLRHVTPEA